MQHRPDERCKISSNTGKRTCINKAIFPHRMCGPMRLRSGPTSTGPSRDTCPDASHVTEMNFQWLCIYLSYFQLEQTFRWCAQTKWNLSHQWAQQPGFIFNKWSCPSMFTYINRYCSLCAEGLLINGSFCELFPYLLFSHWVTGACWGPPCQETLSTIVCHPIAGPTQRQPFTLTFTVSLDWFNYSSPSPATQSAWRKNEDKIKINLAWAHPKWLLRLVWSHKLNLIIQQNIEANEK